MFNIKIAVLGIVGSALIAWSVAAASPIEQTRPQLDPLAAYAASLDQLQYEQLRSR